MTPHYKYISYEHRNILFWLFTSVSVVSIFIYIYALSTTVHLTTERQSLTKELSSLGSKVADLEFKNIAIRNNIDLASALSEGYVEVKNPTFVTRGTQEALTLNVSRR